MTNHQLARVQYGTGKDLAGQLCDMGGFREAERLTCKPLGMIPVFLHLIRQVRWLL